jgi:hypothetical protein
LGLLDHSMDALCSVQEMRRMTVPNTGDSRVVTVKEEILRAIARLPDDAGYDDAFETLYVLYKIHIGRQQLDQGLTIPHEEVVARMEKWLK